MGCPIAGPKLIASLKSILAEHDTTGTYDRLKLKNTAEQLSIALETPGDTAQRIAYYVRSQSLSYARGAG